MRSWINLGLVLSVVLYAVSSQAMPCDATALPEKMYEPLKKREYSTAVAIALAGAKASPNEMAAQVNLAKVYINSALRPVMQIDMKALGVDESKTGVPQKIDMEKLKKSISDDFVVDDEYRGKAEQQINLVLERWPQNKSLLYCLTKIEFYSRDHDKFIQELNRTAQAFLDDEGEAVSIFLNYAQTLYKRNEIKKSSDVYLTALKTFPQNAPLLSSLGVSYLYQGKIRDSVVLFDRAYKIAPEDMIVIGNVAEVSMLIGDFEKAERFLKIKAEKAPEDISIYFDLAMNAMHAGVENSLPYWERYFKENEKHPDEQQWLNAAKVIYKAIQDGISVEDQLDVANQFIEGFKTPKYAIAMMTHLKEKDRAEPAYPYRLGQAYDRGNFFELSENALKETLQRLQSNPSKYMDLSRNEILYNISRMTYAQEKYDESLHYLELMEKTEEDKANTGYMYGLVYTSLNKEEKARKAYELCSKSSSSESLRKLCGQKLTRQ